jgi:ATPase subunit of ABC transporter with duplicated ATPase domains
VGYVDVSGIRHTLPDGRVLLDDVSFRVGEGVRAALVGENGAGKTTLLRIIAGDLIPEAGAVARVGGLGVMRQFIGSVRDDTNVQRFLVDLSPPAVREAWDAVEAAELALMENDDERGQMTYAHALSHWGDVGGYDAEVTWDTVTVAALGVPYDGCKYRELSTLSGGEQKRLALEALLRGTDEVLLLDEPDNYLDVPGKRWLEERLLETRKTVLFVSHDRELLARVADRVVTVEGGTAWVHGGGFASYHEARSARHDRMAELRRRWDEEHQRLIDLVRTLQQQALRSGDRPAARHALRTALVRAERLDVLRPFALAGQGQRVLLVDQLGGDRDPDVFAFRCLAARRQVRRSADPQLSAREQDVLAQLVSLSNLGEIADDLAVSVNTVKSHVRAIYGKLGVNSRRNAILTALERGMLA